MNRPNYPIDFVLPWVDGSDPAWLAQKREYSVEVTSDTHSFDYQDWGLLPYWFRCIETNAPWVRNIYFVTWGHVPEWLNTDHPKLKIINHKDFIPEEYLPTFSSHTIELNLHRIKGLSEHFVYFNDDTYLYNSADPDFFFHNGLPRDCAVINPVAPANNNCIASLKLTTAAMINEDFSKHKVIGKNLLKWYNVKYFPYGLLNVMFIPWGRFVGFYEQHLPSSMLKSTYEEVWKKQYDVLNNTCLHKFRDFKTDVNQWIMKEWQIASGNFSPRSVHAGKLIAIHNMQDAQSAAKTLRSTKMKMVCLNDHVDTADYKEIAEVIRREFDQKFPNKSQFEK